MELATQTQAYTTKHDVLQIMMILRDKKIYKSTSSDFAEGLLTNELK